MQVSSGMGHQTPTHLIIEACSEPPCGAEGPQGAQYGRRTEFEFEFEFVVERSRFQTHRLTKRCRPPGREGSCRLGNGKEGASGEVMERRSCKSAGANVVRSGEREQEVYSWSNFFFLNLRLAEAVNIQKGKLTYRIRGHTQLPTRPNTWSNRD
jgi:hypothetical protein